MSYVRNKLKFAVLFLIIASLVLLSMPSNLIGEGDSTDLEALQKAVTQAAEVLGAAQTAADDADSALAEAQAAADDADSALAAAKTAADDAAAALTAAQQAVADAQAALDSAVEGEDTEALEQALDDANSALAEAQTAADDADSALVEAQAAADDANSALEAAKTAADDAEAALATAEQAAADAQAALDAALAALEEEAEEEESKGEEEESNEEVVYDPIIYSDKDDYHPGEEVTIYGEGFVPNEDIQIIFYAITEENPDGVVEHSDIIDNVGEDGTFEYKYNIIGADKYKVEARTVVESNSGETEFLETGSVEFEVEVGITETIILGDLLAWTEFTDTPHIDFDYSDCSRIEYGTDWWGDWVKYDSWDDEESYAVFPHSSSCFSVCDDIIITKVVIKAGDGYGSEHEFTGDGQYDFYKYGKLRGSLVVDFNDDFSSVEVYESWGGTADNPRYTRNISHVTFYYNCIEYGSIRVIKDVKTKDNQPVDDPHIFYAKLQVEEGWDWVDVEGGVTKPFSETSYAEWTGLVMDKQYRAVETDDPNYTEVDKTIETTLDTSPKTITFINKQKEGELGVKKNVTNVYNDDQKFWAELYVNDSEEDFDPDNPTSNGWTLVSKKQIWEEYNHVTIWNNLVKGKWYEVREVNVPSDYEFIDTDGPAYLACQVYITVQNEQVSRYPVSFEKTFEALPSEDAEFDIYADDGSGNPTGLSLGHDSLSGDGMVEFTDLLPGDYVIVETSTPPEFAQMDDILISIADDGTVSGLPTSPVFNELLRGSITICKTDATNGEPLLGSTFELWKQTQVLASADSNGVGTLAAANVNFGWIKIDEIVLTNSNCYTWDNLPYGNYMVRETVAPQGYLLCGDVYVTVDSETPNPKLEEEIADPRKTGKIGIRKVDENGDAMVGVGFTLYNSTGTTVIRSEQFTDAAGKVAFGNLAWGSYLIVETTVPAGYTKVADVPVIVNAGNAGTVINVTIKNTPGGGGGEELTVLGIQELPFTGMHPAIPISSITMILGGLAMFIASLKRRFKRK